MDELNFTHDQLKRMRSMNKFYHHQFLIDVRIFFTLGLIALIFAIFDAKIVYVLPFLSLFGSVILAFHAYYLIFSRHYSEYLEKNINKITKKQVFITHELENRYFFPINDKKIVVAKIGKDFSWFSFVTLFITLYGLILYIFGMINIYNVFNDTVTFYGILILTVVTFAIGYWWFVNNTGEKRLREVYVNLLYEF